MRNEIVECLNEIENFLKILSKDEDVVENYDLDILQKRIEIAGLQSRITSYQMYETSDINMTMMYLQNIKKHCGLMKPSGNMINGKDRIEYIENEVDNAISKLDWDYTSLKK